MLQHKTRRMMAVMLALLCSPLGIDVSHAQSATPAAYPVAPDPADCLIEPLPVDDIVAILATPAAAASAASPAPFAIPAGEPADAETSAAVITTLYQVFACANAGDPSRVAAHFTDDFARVFFAGAPVEVLTDFLAAAPQPLPEEQKRIIRGFGEVNILNDGRAGVVIVLDEPDDPRSEEPDFVILEMADGRWLVDAIHEDGGLAAEATPAP